MVCGHRPLSFLVMNCFRSVATDRGNYILQFICTFQVNFGVLEKIGVLIESSTLLAAGINFLSQNDLQFSSYWI